MIKQNKRKELYKVQCTCYFNHKLGAHYVLLHSLLWRKKLLQSQKTSYNLSLPEKKIMQFNVTEINLVRENESQSLTRHVIEIYFMFGGSNVDCQTLGHGIVRIEGKAWGPAINLGKKFNRTENWMSRRQELWLKVTYLALWDLNRQW